MKRLTPEIGSIPTLPSASPSPTIRSDFTSDPPLSRERAARPKTVSAKYSGGPKRSATSAKSVAKRMSPSTPSVPATNEPTADTARAAPARPRRAIW